MPELRTRPPAFDRRRAPRQSAIHIENILERNHTIRCQIEEVMRLLEDPAVPRAKALEALEETHASFPDWYAEFGRYHAALCSEINQLRPRNGHAQTPHAA
jgi:hypothetical protein